MDKRIYFIQIHDKSWEYGVGTYCRQIRDIAKEYSLPISFVSIYAPVSEYKVNYEEGIKEILIPADDPDKRHANQKEYIENICRILHLHISSKEQPVFHLNFLTSAYLAYQLKQNFNCKLVVTIHYTNWGIELMGDFRRLKSILEKEENEINLFERRIRTIISSDEKLFSLCDKIICPAQHTTRFLKEVYRTPAEKIEVINHGLPDYYKLYSSIPRTTLRKKYLIPPEAQLLIFAGRANAGKGIYFLLDAFKEVVKTHPDTYLIIAGEGDLNKIIQYVNPWFTRIILTEKVEQQQLFELFSIADIGIVPSLYEEFGYVAIEMMMHSLPIIVSNTGGLAEIIENEKEGYKISVYEKEEKIEIDVSDLTNKIKVWLDNPALCKETGMKARNRYFQKYTSEEFAEKMCIFYKEAGV